MNVVIPELSLVLLMGASGAGKSTFARKHFRASEVLSSDYCRYLVSDDENNQAATSDAFELLRFIAAKRLGAARLTVVDATNVQPQARKPLLDLARRYHAAPGSDCAECSAQCLSTAQSNSHRPDFASTSD